MDLGLKHDHSALVVVDCDVFTGKFKLVHAESWAPPRKGGQVSLEEVKQAVLLAIATYDLDCLTYDPWQMAPLHGG